MQRRSFLHAFGAGVLGAHGSFAVTAQEEEFTIPLLGDLHYDKLEHHDFEWMRREHVGDVKQVENYSRVTRDWSPRLLEVVKQQITRSTARIPFLLQLGDLIEGLCGNEALAERQAREAVAWMQQSMPGVPFAMCKGNHDVTGPGATQVYDRVLVPFLQSRLNGVDAARFTRDAGGTLMVFYDAYDKSSLDRFATLMAEKQPRRLIFVIHPPVVPYNARASWHIFAKPAEAEKRTRLLELLGQHHALVLCGHLHKFSCLTRRTTTGSFTQLAISSVATNETGEAKDARHGLEAYTPDLVELEPAHSPETADARRALLAAERPFITHYEYADTWGHALLHVSRDGMKAEVSRGFSIEAWREIEVAAL